MPATGLRKGSEDREAVGAQGREAAAASCPSMALTRSSSAVTCADRFLRRGHLGAQPRLVGL